MNNTQLDVTGKGSADFDAGKYKMSLDVPRVPMHWDPAFVILICCDRMLGVCARQLDGAQNIHSLAKGEHTLAWREGKLYDAQGRECGWAQASSYGRTDGNTMVSRSQLLNAHFHLELLEEITRIPTPYVAIMQPFGDDIVLVTSAYSFETNHGNTYRGYTTYPYKMTPQTKGVNNLNEYQLLTVEDVQLSRTRDPHTGSIKLDFEIQQSVRPLKTL